MKQLHVFTLLGTAYYFFDGQFKYLVEHGYDITLCSCDDEMAQSFAQRNKIKFVPIDIPRSLSLKRIIYSICVVYSLIKKEKFDMVVGHTPVGALVAMTAARIAGLKNRVYYRHGLIYTTMSGFKRSLFKMEERFVSYLATHIVNVSPSLSSLALKERLNRARKQSVINNGTCGGIDTIQTFNPTCLVQQILDSIKTSLNLSENNLIFGFCGRICKDKGVVELLEAFTTFRAKHPEEHPKLIIIGSYDNRDILSDEIRKRLELNDDILLVGQIEKEKLPYYYSLLDVFVFPSHREGFGMCVIEASAMEKPVLVSRSHGCVDSMVDNETGLYISLESMEICLQMEKLIDKQLRDKLGKQGRLWVKENFERTKLWPEVAALYESILKE